eukprot:2074678-Prymnesium_polylepis.1
MPEDWLATECEDGGAGAEFSATWSIEDGSAVLEISVPSLHPSPPPSPPSSSDQVVNTSPDPVEMLKPP